MLKEIIEKEVMEQGYRIVKWKDHLRGIQVEKNGFYTMIFVDEIVAKIIARELAE